MSESTERKPLIADPDFHSPVCQTPNVFLWIWQQQGSDRIRVFCDDCSRIDEYHVLPKSERVILSYEGFQKFAARRPLRHIVERRRARDAIAERSGPIGAPS